MTNHDLLSKYKISVESKSRKEDLLAKMLIDYTEKQEKMQTLIE